MCVAKPLIEPSSESRLHSASLCGVPEANGWHALEPFVVVTQLGTNPSLGLTTEEVNRRRTRYGSNALQKVRPRPVWRLLVDQFASIVIALLGVAATVAWILLCSLAPILIVEATKKVTRWKLPTKGASGLGLTQRFGAL